MIEDGKRSLKPNTRIDSIQIYNLKATRDEAIAAFIAATKQEVNPIVLMGDFNESSFLDWTYKTKNMFNHHGVVIPWHATKKLNDEGFIDVFRTFYPNEVSNPGFTWPSYAHGKGTTSWTPLADERDRIDYVFFKGNGITIKDAYLVGPKESYVQNILNTLNTKNEKFIASDLPWPSDHKGVGAKLLFKFKK
jgi:hypothetical protein